jgi:UDP-glucose:(heptosyl)LPS alpha-1,3-glucosyltransferase
MRVGLVFSGCHPRGGVERVVFEAANALADRHDVTVIAAEADELPSNVRVDLVAMRRGGVTEPFRFRRAAYELLALHDFDVTVSFGANCPPGDVLVVQSVHRTWVEQGTPVHVGPFSVPGAARRIIPRHLVMLRMESQWFARSRPGTVVAVSDGVARDIERHYGVASAGIRVVPNGFSPAQCSEARRMSRRIEWRDRLGLLPGDVALLLVANEWHRKGLGVVLEAMARVKDSQLRLLLVGRRAPTAYEAQIARLGLQERVRWYGAASDVSEYHAASDLFVMPTTYEGFGSVIVEALGSGVPVITSALAGAAMAVREDSNGLLLRDPTDPAELAAALDRALMPGTIDRWSATAAHSVADFTWPRVMQQFEAAVLECAGERGRA